MSSRATFFARTPARALLWEEGRTGGAIATACTLVGVLLLLWSRYLIGENAWEREDFLTRFATLWIPVGAGLLLVLNPDYSGHLVGGFSKRVLRFPITAQLAVGIALAARAVLVLASSTLLLLVAHQLFDGAPRFATVLVIVTIYLLAQVIDWLRGPISGLSSVIAVVIAGTILSWIWPGGPEVRILDTATDVIAERTALVPVFAVVAIAVAYAVSVVAVRTDRIGRRYGIPEIWEWPRRFSITTTRNCTPFRSVLAAQIWFEIRRSRFLLPLIALVVSAAAGVVAWLVGSSYPDSWTLSEQLNLFATVGIASGILFGAMAHGIQTRVVGFRGAGGKPGYEYLQPLSDAQFAIARVIASLAMLLPTLLVGALIHYGVAGRVFTFEIVPEIHRAGVSSPREIAWMFMGRLLLLGLLAWFALGVGTRMIQLVIGVVFAVLLIGGMSDVYLSSDIFDHGATAITTLLTIGLLVLVTAVLLRALFAEVLPARHLVALVLAWLGLAWVLHYPLRTQWVLEPVPFGDRFGILATSLGIASIGPLVYLAILRDVFRRRHPRAVCQSDPSGVGQTIGLTIPKAIAAFVVGVLVLWLGWPATPTYVDYRRDQGFPATPAEMNEYYPEPPTGQNAAPRLLAIGEACFRRDLEFKNWFYYAGAQELSAGSQGNPNYGSMYLDNLYIAGKIQVQRSRPLDPHLWKVTEQYWSRVSSPIAQRLRALDGLQLSLARYEIDLRDGYQVTLEHLSPVRLLNRQLLLDTLQACVVEDPERALENVETGLEVASSLQNEPLLISQLVRVGMVDNSLSAAAMMLNRMSLTDAELARLQRIIGTMNEEKLRESFGRAFVGESVNTLDIVNRYALVGNSAWEYDSFNTLTLAGRLAFPADAQRAVISLWMTHVMNVPNLDSWQRVASYASEWTDDRSVVAYTFISPTVAILMPAYGRSWESVIRTMTQRDSLRVAVAIERYRLAHGGLPSRLDELVPEFLSKVPIDRYATGQTPLTYRVDEDGAYTVYSVGRNGKDDSGDASHDSGHNDLVTFVAAKSLRTGPKIAPEPTLPDPR